MKKKSNKPISLQWKLIVYMVAFTGLLLGFIYLFQVQLLTVFYENNKLNMTEEIADQAALAVAMGQSSDSIESLSMENEACISVISTKRSLMANSSSNSGCSLDKMTRDEYIRYYTLATKAGGTYYETISQNSYIIEQDDSRVHFYEKEDAYKSIIYAKVVESGSEAAFVLVSTNISPINATIKTLNEQLVYIGAIFIVAAVVLSFILYHKIVKPITMVNEASKGIVEGNYQSKEGMNEYLEISELDETLKWSSEQIQKADQAKRDLIANVSHDLRTPLTMITGYGEMMLDLPDEKNDENIQVIVDEAKRMTLLVNDLLDLSKMNENKIEIHKEVFDLTKLIENTILKYDLYKDKGFVFNLNLAQHVLVEADENRIAQVIHNLINNAINYSLDKKQIDITLETINKVAIVHVKDYGMGISEDKLPYIFERYYKIDKEHKRSSAG
ncbi:MAG: HAMP domain-containing histidine kinase, partial [Erysipelotrichaceae bacterium]|nr:HAMP domain-containing histidine kinase [Erysipelotrichaceae bacterium]